MLRAIASTQSINNPPDKTAIGNSRRWEVPAIARATCGIINPTNPIVPQTDTNVPVSSDSTNR